MADTESKQAGFHMKPRQTSIITTTIIVGLLAACSTPPPGYNTTGSTGQLIRQATGFDGNVCHYDNGITLNTQGNCPPTATSSVYQRAQ